MSGLLFIYCVGQINGIGMPGNAIVADVALLPCCALDVRVRALSPWIYLTYYPN